MAAENGGNRHFNIQRIVYVFDRREGDSPEISISLTGIPNFQSFLAGVREVFSISDHEEFVLVTTERFAIDDESYDLIEGGDTLYLLHSCDQDLPAPVRERVEFLPHYDTLTKSGMYEYYASEGQNPLPFAFAELLDNALYATSTNTGLRKIEIRLMFDDTTNHNSVCVLDNGRGMNSKELNDWAVYRLSKHNRSLRRKYSEHTPRKHVPRALNSDISYFGVGGKQAIFFIGNSTRMISKCAESNDVHEMILSKEEFKQKEKNKEAIYSGTIFNRTVCDVNHVASEDDHLRKLILQESNEKSFTKVFITSVQAVHVNYLKSHFMNWCRELAHIYHYYLHGPHGNTVDSAKVCRNIEISASLYDKGRSPKHIKLGDIIDDIQTLYVRTAASTFDFKVESDGDVLEGQLRYHPFLYDRETYPTNFNASDKGMNEVTDDDDVIHKVNAPRGDRPIFGCFWNGRLIPYTSIKSFEWCDVPRKRTSLPIECYNRFSGVLWADDSFKVSTNKLTFMDLELKLADRSSSFTRVISGQDQRIPISKAFHEWVKYCHETFDKQIRFFDMQGQTRRTDLSGRKNQSIWTVFNGIEWHGNIYNKGDFVKTCRTSPMIIGSINRFILNGEYKKGDVFMTGGEVEIIQEPSSLYGEKRIFPLDRLDRFFQQDQASEIIKAEELKLPSYLTIEWPEGNELKQNAVLAAGAPIGAMKVDIMNGKHEPCNKIPGAQGKRLLVELKVIGMKGKNRNVTVIQHTCQHGGKSWPYWFRRMENINTLGEYVLCLKVLLADTTGPKTLKRLPYSEINFTVTVGKPYKFTVERLDTAHRSGVPFKMHLNILDYYGNITTPKKVDGTNITVSANDETFQHGDISVHDNTIVLNDVVGFPKVDRIDGKDINVKVVYLNLDENSQTIKARFLPGLPSYLDIKPIEDTVTITNGSSVRFYVIVKDQAGNMTADPKSQVNCKLTSSTKLPSYAVDCSSGKGIFAIPSIDIKGLRKDVTVNAKFDMQNHKSVEAVKKQIHVLPGVRPAVFEVQFLLEGCETPTKVTDGEEVLCSAGGTISGITFKILDEGNRILTVDDSIASKVKVNWATKMQRDKISLGQLPNIKVPCSVSESKFCQVICSSASTVEFTFTLRPQAKGPHSLHCKYFGINKVSPDHPKLGIIVEVQDCFGNCLPMVLEDSEMVEVSGDGVDTSMIKREINEDGNLILNNILFKDLTPGNREISFEYKGLQAYQKVDVLPGPPAGITYTNLLSGQVIPVRNGHKWDGSIQVQVVDAAGHPCKDANIQICLKNEGNMKYVLPKKSSHMSQISQHTDGNGQATFSDFSLFSPLKHGEFKITPRASLGKFEIKASPLIINLLADPNKAVKIINTLPIKKIFAGDILPEIKCCVYAEDDNIMTNIESSNVTLKIWTTSNTTKANPNKTMMYCPNEFVEDDEPYHFYFRDLKAPSVSGKCYISTQYKGSLEHGSEVVLQSEMSYLQVLPKRPVKLVPVDEIPTPTVSNTQNIVSRTLIKNYRLCLVDEYNNNCIQTEKGIVKIHVEKSPFECPLLNNNESSVEYPLVKGECTIDILTVPDGTVGKNEQQYRLFFEPIFNGEKDENIEPYILPFLFYNDAEKQKQMAHRLKERDKLAQTINTYRVFFKTTRQLIKEMNVSVEETGKLMLKVKNSLRVKGEDIESLVTIPNIRKRIHTLEKEITVVKAKPQRKCSLVPAERHALILGKVAHLAEVEDDDVARVLSWHMSGDMDCIVTLNTAKAKEVYKQSNGHQQVLPMDSIYRKNLPMWQKDLPHKSLSGIWKGNPIFARHLLKITNDEAHCKTVFSMLLGDTIIIDDLDCANEYRYKLVKYCYCPTILTRTGERIRSNGKFGGMGNKAPPLEKLHGNVFPAPTSKKVDELSKTIESLLQLEEAMSNNNRAKDELQLQIAEGRSEQMQLKYKECVDAERKLAETEEELGMTPSQYETPDPISLLNVETGNLAEESSELPSEQLLKTIHKEVGNSIRMHNMMKRRGSPDNSERTPSKRKSDANEKTPTTPRRGNRAEIQTSTPKSEGRSKPNISDKRKGGKDVTSSNPYKRSYKEEQPTRQRSLRNRNTAK